VTIFPTVRRAGMRTVGDGCLIKEKFESIKISYEINRIVTPKKPKTNSKV